MLTVGHVDVTWESLISPLLSWRYFVSQEVFYIVLWWKESLATYTFLKIED